MGEQYVSNILSYVGNGVTKPLNATLSDGRNVIIKMNNNDEGNLTLINEYISYNLAICFGINVPDSGIAIINEKTLIGSNEILIENDNLGHCFYSTRIDRANILNEKTMSFVENKEDLMKMILFDHIIYNKDRNKGNLIISQMKESIKVYIIDHTHVFKNECIWNKFTFIQGIKECDYNDFLIFENNKFIYDMVKNTHEWDINIVEELVEDFKSRYVKFDYKNIISKIPEGWKNIKPDLEELIQYLDYRMSHIDDIKSLIIDNIL